MTECTLHNLLTSCQYPQVFWIYQTNDYDENILLTKGTKQEMMEDDENNFDLLDHINDVVEYWTIREDGAMFVRIRMDDRAKELYSDDYVKKWDRFNPNKRPYLYTAEMDDFTHCIYGSSEYLHPYGDPNECHHYGTADRKTENSSEKPNNCEDEFFREPTAEERKAVADYIDSISVPTGVNVFDLMDEPTISKMEQVDKDINVRSKDEPQRNGWSVEYAREMLNTMTCEKCGHWEHGAGDHYYCALLEMRQECYFESKGESTLMFANKPKDEPQTERSE